MKFKLWRRRMSVSSPRVTIRTPWSWPARVFGAALIAVAGLVVALWVFDQGRAFTGLPADDTRQQLAIYKEQLARLTAERDQFSSTVNSAESELNIERSAQRQMINQVKALEAENARLKEDLAFYDSLLPSATGPNGIAIRRLKIDQIAPNQLRYRLLIMQGGKGDQLFSGTLQLAVTTLQDGKSAMMVFPEENDGEPGKFKLGFRHYQRIEGVLALPDGVSATLVTARVLEKGQVRAHTSANL